MKQLYDQICQTPKQKEKTCWINCEDLDWAHIQTYTDLYQVVREYSIIFIDEIQRIPQREKAINSLHAK
jgi:predicted AAA+ superfamily ATPase